MKIKINTTPKINIKAVLLALLFTIAFCIENKAFSQNTAVVKTPPIDIFNAILTDNLPVLKQHIAAGTYLNQKDPFGGGSSPLIIASLLGKTLMAKALIDAHADLNFRNNDGSTALHIASFFCRPEIVKMLLQRGADKTIKNKYGSTAYESVAGTFTKVKDVYDMTGKMLAPLGLKLDYTYIEKTRPEIASLLK
jgi:ankyrin repeat protein